MKTHLLSLAYSCIISLMSVEHDSLRRYSGRRFILVPEDRNALKAAMESLGLSQIDVANLNRVSQSWLSNLLAGKLPVRDRDALQRILADVGNRIDQSASLGRLNGDTAARLRGSLDFLREGTGMTDIKPLVDAWNSIPTGAANYVHRNSAETRIEELLRRDRGHWNFTLAIAGSPDSGKSTHLGFLQGLAIREGVQIAKIDCHDIASENSQIEKRSKLFGLLAEEVADSWHLPLPDEITANDRFERYVRKGLQGLSEKDRAAKRLLVIDDIDRLGNPQVIDELLATLEVGAANKNVRGGPRYALAIGLSPDSLQLFRILRYSEFGTQIRMEWFNQNQVYKLIEAFKLRGSEQIAQQLYQWFGGQPFLTHRAVAMLAIERKTPDRVYQEALAGEGHFGWHVRTVRNMLAKEPDLQALLALTIENSRVDPIDLNIPPFFREYSIATGLLRKGDDGMLFSGSSFYADLASQK